MRVNLCDVGIVGACVQKCTRKLNFCPPLCLSSSQFSSTAEISCNFLRWNRADLLNKLLSKILSAFWNMMGHWGDVISPQFRGRQKLQINHSKNLPGIYLHLHITWSRVLVAAGTTFFTEGTQAKGNPKNTVEVRKSRYYFITLEMAQTLRHLRQPSLLLYS